MKRKKFWIGVAACMLIGTASVAASSGVELHEFFNANRERVMYPMPVVFLYLSIRAFSTCPIQPDHKDITVFCQQLSQLVQIVIIIFFSFSIGFIVSVPWRKINTKFETKFPACLCGFSDNITFSVLIWGIFDAVFCIFRWP